jgi:hypothetical protein
MRSMNTLEVSPVRFATDTEIALPVVVCSHERSGTHFLINSIAKNSQFRNDPYLDYDIDPLGSLHNFYDQKLTRSFFVRLAENKCSSIIKSHHAAQFFLDDTNKFLLNGICKALYIVRNPIDVMLSYHRLVKYFYWHEGPKPERVIDFLKAAPEGRMLRYQNGQVDTILERWKLHLLAWCDLAAANPADVLLVRYQDLDRDHMAETKKILSFLDCECPDVIARPDRNVRTVYVPPAPAPSFAEREEIRQLIIAKIGPCAAIEILLPELYR